MRGWGSRSLIRNRCSPLHEGEKLKPDIVIKNQAGIFVGDVTIHHEDGVASLPCGRRRSPNTVVCYPNCKSNFAVLVGRSWPLWLEPEGPWCSRCSGMAGDDRRWHEEYISDSTQFIDWDIPWLCLKAVGTRPLWDSSSFYLFFFVYGANVLSFEWGGILAVFMPIYTYVGGIYCLGGGGLTTPAGGWGVKLYCQLCHTIFIEKYGAIHYRLFVF